MISYGYTAFELNDTSMQIPEQFPAFHKKTLVVVADHEHAKLFIGNDRDFQFAEELKTDYPSHEGGDRTSGMTGGGAHFREVNEKDEIVGEDHLFRKIAKDLETRLQNHEYEDLVIAAGPEVHQFEKLLHPDVRTHVTHLIPKLLVKLDDEHLIEHLELGETVTTDRS